MTDLLEAPPSQSSSSEPRRRNPLGNRRLTLRGVRWTTYVAMTKDPAFAHKRLTYNRGKLQIMSPSAHHERITYLLSRLVEMMAYTLNISIAGYRSTTFKRLAARQGLEPDECYYVANSAEMADRTVIDLRRDPPPDLVLETDLTSSSVDKLAIYAAMGVPEIWRFDAVAGTLSFLLLDRTPSRPTYRAADRSAAFAFLAPADVSRCLARRAAGESTLIREFAAFAASELSARRAALPSSPPQPPPTTAPANSPTSYPSPTARE